MTRIQYWGALRFVACFLAAVLLTLGTGRPAAAQQEDAVDQEEFQWQDNDGDMVWVDATLQMTIFYSAAGAEIDAFAETDVFPGLTWWDMDVYAETDLYLNGDLIGFEGDEEGVSMPVCSRRTPTCPSVTRIIIRLLAPTLYFTKTIAAMPVP